ncbi:MAG: hypothetical protein CME31_20365 [Gimesia sp.]|nr:hypothetical protein [Gimesia sp.]
MILEEKKAKKKVCPNRQLQPTEIDSYHPFDCIASQCMAWRWIAKGAKMGYCGLAGEPRELNFQ